MADEGNKKTVALLEGLVAIFNRKGLMKQLDAAGLMKDFENHEAQYVEDFLLEEGLVDKDDLLDALEEYYDVPAVDVLGEIFDHDLVSMFPKDILLRNYCIPYYREENILFVITKDPSDDDLNALLREFVSYDIEFMVGLPRHIEMMVKDFYQEELYVDDPDEIIGRAQHEVEDERYEMEKEREEEEEGDPHPHRHFRED